MNHNIITVYKLMKTKFAIRPDQFNYLVLRFFKKMKKQQTKIKIKNCKYIEYEIYRTFIRNYSFLSKLIFDKSASHFQKMDREI